MTSLKIPWCSIRNTSVNVGFSIVTLVFRGGRVHFCRQFFGCHCGPQNWRGINCVPTHPPSKYRWQVHPAHLVSGELTIKSPTNGNPKDFSKAHPLEVWDLLILPWLMNALVRLIHHPGDLFKTPQRDNSKDTWATKNPSYLPWRWLFNRDPYSGLL